MEQTKSTLIRTLPLAAVALVTGLSLTGCSFGYTAATSIQPSTSQSASTVETPASTTATTASASTSEEADQTAVGAEARSELKQRITGTVECTDGKAEISSVGAAVELDQTCEDVTVSGNAVVLLAGEVTHLTVSGTGSVVLVASAQTVTVEGTGNVVSWESGSPAVTTSGTGNVVGSN